MKVKILTIAVFGLVLSCTAQTNKTMSDAYAMAVIPEPGEGQEVAVLASGCFWGTEYYLQKIPGVLATTCGYTGGMVKNPSYREVCTKRTGHYEAVHVVFDPSQVSFEELARVFFELTIQRSAMDRVQILDLNTVVPFFFKMKHNLK